MIYFIACIRQCRRSFFFCTFTYCSSRHNCRTSCLFIGTFVEAIDRQNGLWYTIIVIDFCAPSDWDSWDYPGSLQICCIAHVVRFVRLVVGLLCPLPFLSHVNIGMNSDFPVGLMFPSNGRSKCMERLEAPIGCSRRFCIVADCKGGIERNTLERPLIVFGLTSTILRIPSSAGRNLT